jgi:hypothetical protein
LDSYSTHWQGLEGRGMGKVEKEEEKGLDDVK